MSFYNQDLAEYQEWQARIQNPGFLSNVTGQWQTDSNMIAGNPTPGAQRYMNQMNALNEAKREEQERWKLCQDPSVPWYER